MSQKVQAPFFEGTLPAKVFVLGEYAVLAGQPAWVATFRPDSFRLKVETIKNPVIQHSFHDESPAGVLIKLFENKIPELCEGGFSFQFQNALEVGGFGSSTAEFALSYLALMKMCGFPPPLWNIIWKYYRDVHEKNALPSGADLVAQLQARELPGLVQVEIRQEEAISKTLSTRDLPEVHVFSAAHQALRKTATHAHIQTYRTMPENEQKRLCSELSQIIHEVALSPHRLPQVMNHYAEILYKYGLENLHAHEDRKWLSSFPGVLGVKGSGAMLSDSMIVAVDETWNEEKCKIIENERNLKWLGKLWL